MQVCMEEINRIVGDLNRGNPRRLKVPCAACGAAVTVEIHRTSAGYGFNGAVPVAVTEGELRFQCLACQKKERR